MKKLTDREISELLKWGVKPEEFKGYTDKTIRQLKNMEKRESKKWNSPDQSSSMATLTNTRYGSAEFIKFLWKVPSWWHKWKFWWFHHAAKKISQLSIEWEIIKIWDSVADAERWLWLNWKNISMCATWKYKTAYWYKWIYS